MSSELSKQDYLKRYLENEKDANRKRKKKSKKKAEVPCLKIIDTDIDLKSINFGGKEEEDEDDEAPVVAEIIDERPVEEKVKEQYESSRWRKINDDEISLSSYPKSEQNYSKNTRYDSDSDMSPPRFQERMGRKDYDSSDLSPQRDQNKNPSDSDISPPRSYKQRKSKSRHDSGSDISPPRHKLSKVNSAKEQKPQRHDSDSDISPPRHQTVDLSQKKQRSKRSDLDRDSSSPYVLNKTKKLDKTLSGLKSGLQNPKTLQKEIQELRERERNQLNTLDDEISGRNAETVIRDRKTGLKRDLNQEQQKKNEKDEKTKEYQKKYTEWGKGIEQTMDKVEKLKDDLYEMTKPLARYKDDEDLDERLKSIIHDDDPMAEYIKKKKQKDVPSLPAYSGPLAPPNRFGILPGYRWDGVDRSNGFERKYFEKINKSKAVENEAYLWSVQDM